jgi:hypothetical protein
MTGWYVKTYVTDGKTTSYTPEEGAHSPSWPNGLIIIIVLIGILSDDAVDVNTSHTPEEGIHSPSWPNRLNILLLLQAPN